MKTSVLIFNRKFMPSKLPLPALLLRLHIINSCSSVLMFQISQLSAKGNIAVCQNVINQSACHQSIGRWAICSCHQSVGRWAICSCHLSVGRWAICSCGQFVGRWAICSYLMWAIVQIYVKLLFKKPSRYAANINSNQPISKISNSPSA